MHPCHETQISCKDFPTVSSKGLHLNSGDLRVGSHSLVFCVKVQDSRIAEKSHFHIQTLHLLPWPCEIKHEMHGFFSKLNILAGIMKYFKILMIEHLNNSLWLEILRGMNCMFRGGRSLTYSEDQNFCFSSFNIWKF